MRDLSIEEVETVTGGRGWFDASVRGWLRPLPIFVAPGHTPEAEADSSTASVSVLEQRPVITTPISEPGDAGIQSRLLGTLQADLAWAHLDSVSGDDAQGHLLSPARLPRLEG